MQIIKDIQAKRQQRRQRRAFLAKKRKQFSTKNLINQLEDKTLLERMTR